MIRALAARPSVWAPVLLSAALSWSCLGDRAYWQDSGYFLTTVKEFTALYPPGFVMYLLLCKAWTLLLGFVDFTRAVHLFSAACAAAAAGALGAATSAWLRTREGLLKVIDGPLDARREEFCGAGAGMLAACGYTFWASGILAKGYALLYLVLALLLWRMVVAAERRRPRDFTIVAVLIGLAWQAHPSAAGAGLALLLFVGAHARVLGGRGCMGRTALAAAAALGPSLLLLPWLASGESLMGYGEPRSAGELLRYVAGAAFTGREGAFGWQADRWGTAASYCWEEFLGAGLLLAGWGAWKAFRANGRAAGGILAWAGLYTLLPTLFILEGQQDHWYVAAWLPLHLLVGLGLRELVLRAGLPAAGLLVLAGAAWAAAWNRPDLDQRTYDLAETYGRFHLEPLAPDALLIATSDETGFLGNYLQRVRGLRPDVIVVRRSHLEGPDGGLSWYDRRLLKKDSRLRAPDYRALRERFPRAPREAVVAAAFANANAGPARPVYFEKPPPFEMLREGYEVIPSGPLLKMVPKGSEEPDPRRWAWPIEAEDLRRRRRRPRGQELLESAAGLRSVPQAYETRLLRVLVRSRFLLADWHFRRGAMAPARDLFESILRADPATEDLEEVLFPLAVACARVGPPDRAQILFRVLLARPVSPAVRSRSWFHLGEMAVGRPAEARQCWARALESMGPGEDPAYRREVERRLKAGSEGPR